MPIKDLIAEEENLAAEIRDIRNALDAMPNLEDRLRQESQMQAYAKRLQQIKDRFAAIKSEVPLQAIIPNTSGDDISRAEMLAENGVDRAAELLQKLEFDRSFARVPQLLEDALQVIDGSDYLKSRYLPEAAVSPDTDIPPEAKAAVEQLKTIANKINSIMRSADIAARDSDAFYGLRTPLEQALDTLRPAIKPIAQLASDLVVTESRAELHSLEQQAKAIYEPHTVKTEYQQQRKAASKLPLVSEGLRVRQDLKGQMQERAELDTERHAIAADAGKLRQIESQVKAVRDTLFAERTRYGVDGSSVDNAYNEAGNLGARTSNQAWKVQEKSQTGEYQFSYLRERMPGCAALLSAKARDHAASPC